jgi:hypothetical protein
MSDSDDKKDSKQWPKATVSGLEADIAYFDARLSMLDEQATTTHQDAQSKAYKSLESTLIGMLVKMRMQPDNSPKPKKKKEPDDSE